MTTQDHRGDDIRRRTDTGSGEPSLLLDLHSTIARVEVRLEQASALMDIAEAFMTAPTNSLAVLAALGCANECDAEISDLVDFLPGTRERANADLAESQRFELLTRILSHHGELRERLRQAVEGEWNVFEDPEDFAEWQQAVEWYQHCFRCQANLRGVRHCLRHMEESAPDGVERVAYLNALIEAADDLDLEADEFVGHSSRSSDLTSQEDRDEVYGLACRAFLETREITEREIRVYDAQVSVRFSPTIEQASDHKLRHFHPTIALDEGSNLVVVSRRMGHSKVSTTLELYGHVLPGWQKDLAENVANAIDGDGC